MTIAHRNMTPFGWLKGGRPGMESEKRPNPVSESSPMKIESPDTCSQEPGDENDSDHRTAESGRLHQEEGGEER